ncbi:MULTISPECIES: S1 RNA-binding domain-containing protein [Brevibacillus]|uniref:S1 RNA-binding domain-containing protein n=1 Tax=Brevibacillus TaxID=55080 RepID=UPI0005DB52CA|nr:MULTISPECIES: S1 RNA-binding domain-containing protein [Brevibacillus]MCM3081491.1 S1 RNA-binding domain-containing protein [Brevibacillus invocatus]MCM3431866.1 S1 RNA-binding domain-containing protein [Brevibacillus invocatus]MDH4619104.1 S1 RNA-binding domain-containing protein [Brevibacillus sp. AY1]CFJ39579.1 transcriptional accessory protein [Mycobacterium tuberculosis]
MGVEIGSKLEGKVTGITKFGAFVELPGGATGLVHISEIADTFVKDIHQFLKVGDVVTVKVLSLREGKIGLSIKKAKEQERPPRSPRERGEGFEDKLNRFLKESEERQSTRKKNAEKRGRHR